MDKRIADIGDRRQSWFNTQDLIATASLLTVFQSRPAKHPQNPLMVADRPWEGSLIQLYSPDVHYDAETKQWRMWYEGHPSEVLICTAHSKDGLRWTKPSLGIETWKGNKRNNIVLQTGYSDAHCFSVVKAPTEKDPAKRYKLYYWVHPAASGNDESLIGRYHRESQRADLLKAYKRPGFYVAFSADGVHFTPRTDRPVFSGGWGDFGTVLYDANRKLYRAYYKEYRRGRRAASLAESRDGIRFRKVADVLDADKADDALARSRGYRHMEIYGMHAWCEDDYYLGIAWLYWSKAGAFVGNVISYLIHSPDGVQWKRLPEREPFIPLGPAGSFDAQNIYTTGNGPLIKGDQLWFYYHGTGLAHGAMFDSGARKRMQQAARRAGVPIGLKVNPLGYGGVGLATLPRGRYVGWRAGTVPGTLQTKPFRFAGNKLHLNLDSRRGEARVALLDESGKPLPGFAFDDCKPLSRDSLDLAVAWRGGKDLSACAGKPVRLLFSLRHGVLYTWQFRSEPDDPKSR